MKFLHRVVREFTKVRDKFIPQSISSMSEMDIDQVYRYRLVAGMILVTVPMVIAFTLYYPLASSVGLFGSVVSIFLCISLSGYLIVLLFNLRKSDSHFRVAHRMIASILIVIATGVFFTGGPFGSITSIFLTLPALIAFLLTNRSTALKYVVFTYLIYFLYLVAALMEFQFPQTIPQSAKLSMEAALWMYYTATVMMIIFVYDSLTTRLIHERREEQEKLSYMATHDALTALANRKHFDDQIDQAIHRADRTNTRVALMLIDLNGFKPINDNFGHDAGDILLQHVAKEIKATTRADDIAARIGGDEFAIIIQGELSEDKINSMLTRLSENIAKPYEFEGQQISVTASIGVALFPDHASSVESLRRCADEAMYYAKRNKLHWKSFDRDIG